MPSDKNARPKTGRKTESKTVSMLKKLSASDATGNLPKLPEPTFDREMGSLFQKKTKK